MSKAHIETPVTLGSLFPGFLKAALCGFGGSLLVWARRVIVEERHRMSEAEFADTLSLCQFLPGVNFAHMSICVGRKFRGPLGALGAFSGLTLAPLTIALFLGAGYLRVAHFALVQHLLGGMSGAAAGLVIATGFRMKTPQRRRPAAVLFAGVAFCGIVFTRLPLPVVLLGLAPLSIGASWLMSRRVR